MFTISITEKGGQKRLVECIKSVVTIGRLQGNDIVLPLGNVSKKHAQIQLANDQCTVTDIGSTNGTYVNGRKITRPTELQDGDKIYVGEFIVGIVPNQNAEESVSDAEIVSNERPSIPPPKPKSRKSSPPPSPFNRPAAMMIDENEDTITSIDESKLPNLKSTLQTPLKRPQLKKPQPVANRDSSPPITAPVEQLIDYVAIEERRIDPNILPMVVEPLVAARVRQILSGMISNLIAEGQLPEEYTPDGLFMDAFLSIIDVGPLRKMLVNANVQEIRMNGRDRLLVMSNGQVMPTGKSFETDSLLNNALQCLTAGLPGNAGVGECSGAFRLENGDLVVTQPSWYGQPQVAVIYRSTMQASIQPDARALIRNVLERGGNVAVAGSYILSRLNLVEQILADHQEERIISVESRPLLALESDNHIHFNVSGDESSPFSLSRLVTDVSHFRGDRICIRMSDWQDIPALFRLSALGTPFIADIPLGGGGHLMTSLMSGLLSVGQSRGELISSFTSVVDLMIICAPEGAVDLVDRIVRFEKGEKGTLKLIPMFEANR